METPKASKNAQVSHVEGAVDTSEHQHEDGMAAIQDHILTLTGDGIRDQMAAQIKASKLSFTSKVSIQMYIILFIAYCSMF
jgi:hypothetical protein